jgi:hypothetical protein
MHCDNNRDRKASSEEKIRKTEKSNLRKAGSGILRSELYAVVSVPVCPSLSLSLSLSRSLSVRVCFQQNYIFAPQRILGPKWDLGFVSLVLVLYLVQGQLHMSVE